MYVPFNKVGGDGLNINLPAGSRACQFIGADSPKADSALLGKLDRYLIVGVGANTLKTGPNDLRPFPVLIRPLSLEVIFDAGLLKGAFELGQHDSLTTHVLCFALVNNFGNGRGDLFLKQHPGGLGWITKLIKTQIQV